MRAALHRAAKRGTLDRARDLAAGSRRASPRSGAHASRWCVDELPERTPQPPRLRADRHARRNPFSSRTRVGPSELYGYDAHGNIAFLTDPAGNVTDTYTYEAWGNVVARTGTTSNTRLYAGEEFDPDLGLINLRARQYSPGTGRFLAIDPLMGHVFFPTSFNRYLYAGNDPVGAVDPLGTEAEEEEELTAAEAAPNQASRIVVRVKLPHATAAAKHLLDLASET